MFNTSIILALGAAVLAVLYSFILRAVVFKKTEGNKKLIDTGREIQISAQKFLSKKISAVSIVATIVFVVLLYAMGWHIAIGFLVGAISSALINFLAVNLSARANSRAVEASKKDLSFTFNISLKSGSAIGLFALGIGLLTVAGLFAIFNDITVLIALVFGASMISIFSRFGEIFFKEELKAENISKSVNITSDLFETFLFALVVAMLLANLLPNILPNAVEFPLVLAASFVAINIISTWFVRLFKNSRNIMAAVHRGAIITLVMSFAAFYFVARWMIKTNIIHNMAGFYGLSIFLVFVLSSLGAIISFVILEQSAKDSAEIAKEVNLPVDFQTNINELETAGKTSEKITKYFSILVAFLLAILVFAAFGQKILQANSVLSFDLRDYHILIGLFLGGVFSYYFFQTLRNQRNTVNRAIIESFVAILFPVFVGFILGTSTLGGFLAGAIFIGFFPALFMATTTINSVVKTISLVALLIVPIIVTVNLNFKYRIIISAIIIVLIILSVLIFSPKNKIKFINWLHR